MAKALMMALGGTALATIGGSYLLWRNRDSMKNRFKSWKDQRIRDAYYDTLTEKDIAWG